jgi:hypothetical protein
MECLCTNGVFPHCDNHQQQLFTTWTGDAPPLGLVRLTLGFSGGATRRPMQADVSSGFGNSM